MMNHISLPKTISSRIQMNILFNTKDERNRKRCDRNIHKSMRITVDNHETKKNSTVTVQQNNACKLEFADHLWLPYLDQPQSDIVVFANITFQIYHFIVSKW